MTWNAFLVDVGLALALVAGAVALGAAVAWWYGDVRDYR